MLFKNSHFLINVISQDFSFPFPELQNELPLGKDFLF